MAAILQECQIDDQKHFYHGRGRGQATYAASDPAFTFSKASFD
jgi:hypothetical protein